MTKFFGLLLLVCGVWFFLHALFAKTKASKAKKWPKTKGQILSSKVVKIAGSKPTVYKAQIAYQYTVSGQTYSSNKLNLGGELNSGRPKAQKRCANYPPGSEPDVFYNPTRPEESYLVTKTEGLLFEVAGGIFGVVIGLLLLIGILPPQ